MKLKRIKKGDLKFGTRYLAWDKRAKCFGFCISVKGVGIGQLGDLNPRYDGKYEYAEDESNLVFYKLPKALND
jgi:hypothetical protein